MVCPKIQFDPDFVEEAVFLYAGRGVAPAVLVKVFHEAREGLYAQPSGEKREQAFRIFYEEYFARFGLRAIFDNILSGFPLLSGADILIYVKKVAGRKEEEAELYVDGGMKTVYIGLQAIRILEREFLESFLRFELMHVCDMLDPVFRYSPHPFAEGGVAERENIKNRFRLLWDIYVDSRLKKRGCRPFFVEHKRKKEFQRVFFEMNEARQEEVFSRFQNSEGLSQAELLGLAGCRTLEVVRGH
jgi:hypothetical protein